MRISTKHKYIYIAVPKCGSSAVRDALDKTTDIFPNHHDGGHMIKWLRKVIDNPKAKESPGLQHHFNMKQLIDWCNNNRINIDEYTVFTLIRNPWARVASHYKYMRLKSQLWGQHISGETDLFDLMVNRGAIDYAKRSHEFFTKNKINSFVRWVNVMEEEGKHLSTYANLLTHNDKKPDHIGLCADSQKFMFEMCDRLQIPRVKLQQVNTTSRRPYSRFYNEQTKNLIGEKYHEDIIAHGFKFK